MKKFTNDGIQTEAEEKKKLCAKNDDLSDERQIFLAMGK